MPVQKTVALYTLGCKVNQEEGAAILGLFETAGWQVADFEDKADLYIINTCTVTHLADRKSRQMLRRARRNNPNAIVLATGCYAQVAKEKIAQIEGVNMIIGTDDRANIVNLVENYLHECKNGQKTFMQVSDVAKATEFVAINTVNPHQSRTRANLKIEDGCNQFCSYCIIPYARGPVRSNPPEQVLLQAQALVKEGFKEIVLTGIHTGAYGTDLADKVNFAGLVKRLACIEGLERLRLGSIEPLEVTDELLKVVQTHTNICPHFHIPLQAGQDDILKAMRRNYTTAYYRSLLTKIRYIIPNVAITTDIMVGFPGETEAMFQSGLAFAKEMAFAKMHVFPYSVREGTLAVSLPNQVGTKQKTARAAALGSLAIASEKAFAENYIGQTIKVLWEQTEKKQGGLYYVGHTPNYLPVAVCGEHKLGTIEEVVLKSWQDGYLYA